jgi:hypothetical protein
VDGDGDLDFVTGEAPFVLYINQLNTQPRFANSWLRVRVLDANGRETEHGATVQLRRATDAPTAVQTRVVGGGSGYLAHSEYTAHFGVEDDGPFTLRVSFPSTPDARVVVDGQSNPMLASLRPSDLAGRTIVVYRDGRVVLVEPATQVAEVPPHAQPPGPTQLERAFPNPIQSAGTVEFRLARGGDVSLSIYDVTGRIVKRLTRGALPAGLHAAHWDGTDQRGDRVRAGVYFYMLRVDGRPMGERRVVVLGR